MDLKKNLAHLSVALELHLEVCYKDASKFHVLPFQLCQPAINKCWNLFSCVAPDNAREIKPCIKSQIIVVLTFMSYLFGSSSLSIMSRLISSSF